MPRAHSNDLRKKVLELVKKGKKVLCIAKFLNIPIKTIYAWVVIHNKTGIASPKRYYQQGHSHKIIDLEEFKKFVDLHANLSLEEMALKYGGVSPSTISRAMKKIDYIYKNRSYRAKTQRTKSGKSQD